MKVKVTHVDMDGYCGRERHPVPELRGKVLAVVGMEVFSSLDLTTPVDAGYNASHLHGDDLKAVQTEISDEAPNLSDLSLPLLTSLLFCADEDGRIWDMLDFEVEVVK